MGRATESLIRTLIADQDEKEREADRQTNRNRDRDRERERERETDRQTDRQRQRQRQRDRDRDRQTDRQTDRQKLLRDSATSSGNPRSQFSCEITTYAETFRPLITECGDMLIGRRPCLMSLISKSIFLVVLFGGFLVGFFVRLLACLFACSFVYSFVCCLLACLSPW